MKYSDNYEFSLPNKADGDSADIDPISENFKQIDSILKNIYTKFASQIVFLAENEISLETSPEDIPYGINVCFVNKSSFVNGLVQIGTLIALKNKNLDRHTYQVDEFWIGNTTLVPMQRKSVKTDEGKKVWQEWQRLATEDTVTSHINSFAESENIFKQHILEKLSEIDKRTVNLEQGITPSPFETDDTVAYSKIVPENALPYAEVSKIGGMTYKDGDTLKSAPVTEVESVGKNLISFPYHSTTGEKKGVNWTINDDGSVTANGTATEDSIFVLKNWNLHLKKGAYNLSGLPANGLNSTFMIQFTSLSKKEYSKNVLNVEGVQLTLTEDLSDCIVQCVVFAGYTANNLTFKPMLNKGTTALPYAPFVKHTLPMPVEIQALEGYGWGLNELAYNYIDWEKKQFIKRVNQTVIDDVKEVSNSYTNVKYFAFPKPLDFIGYNGTSNSFIVPKFDTFQSDWDKADNIGKVTGFASYASFYFGFPIGTTFEEAKSVLIGLPVLYELTTPVITDISDILSDDNYIEVEGKGTVTMVNEFEYAVPSEITYQIKGEA